MRVNVAVSQPKQQALESGAAAASDGQKTPSSLDIQFVTVDATEKLGELISFLLVRAYGHKIQVTMPEETS